MASRAGSSSASSGRCLATTGENAQNGSTPAGRGGRVGSRSAAAAGALAAGGLQGTVFGGKAQATPAPAHSHGSSLSPAKPRTFASACTPPPGARCCASRAACAMAPNTTDSLPAGRAGRSSAGILSASCTEADQCSDCERRAQHGGRGLAATGGGGGSTLTAPDGRHSASPATQRDRAPHPALLQRPPGSGGLPPEPLRQEGLRAGRGRRYGDAQLDHGL